MYKRGQAGITKASVTIIFNNSDKKQSPVGFEQCDQITVTRQVVIGGKNKFLINGHVAQNQAVANLFQSVQLNINNPHFLIMQGRITKVLNMKPQEILAMIEEAAGTRMFEEKKEKALKTIGKKDQKLSEINDLMQNDIAPKLDKLKKEKADFMNFQKIEGEVERLKRFIVAHDFSMAEIRLENAKKQFDEKQELVQQLQDESKHLKRDLESIKSSLQEVIARKEKEMKKSSKYRDLQKTVHDLANQLTRLNTQHELKLKAIDEESANLKQIESQISEQAKAFELSKKKHAEFEAEIAQEKKDLKEYTDSVQKQESFLQTLTTGISASEGQEYGFAEQIQSAHEAASSAKTKIEQSKQRIAFLKEQVDEKSGQLKDSQKDLKDLTKQKERMASKVEAAKTSLSKVKFDDKSESVLQEKIQNLRHQIEKLQDEIDVMSSRLSNLDFQFSDPYKGFDRNKVKGLVAKLIKIDPSKLDFATALQICAEGRLYFVVVEDNKVASDLLTNGKLKRKYTIIPLKQIVTPKVSADRVNHAKNLAPGKVELALELIGYEDDVLPAMKFVFGSTFICKDAAAAKKVAYDPVVKMRAITLDGDVYEPGATITGGSRPSSSDLLGRIAKLNELEQKMYALQQELMKYQDEFDKVQQQAARYHQLERELRTAELEFESAEKILSGTSAGLLLKGVDDMKEEMSKLQEQIVGFEKTKKDSEKQAKELEKEMKEFSTNRGSKLKKLEKDVAKAKSDLQKRSASFKEKQGSFITSGEEVQQAERELVELKVNLESAADALNKMKADIKEGSKDIAALTAEYDKHNYELEKLNAAFAKFDSEIRGYENERKEKQNTFDSHQLEIQKSTHEIDRLEQDLEQHKSAIKSIASEHEWIEDQRMHFGKPNTAFDFTAQNPVECRKRLKQLETEHDSLRKTINVKVMNMIDRVVTKERSLKQMLSTVCKDKQKIEDTIEQLDQYKRDALNRTWTKVNGDFGAIFNELLPGNSAKLDPPEGQTISDGLEVKVSLGGVWKQSLTELSGGQRSLVALSLILSLLQFKPAPMYILDEIDAALDLSHTQNIGHLFKTRFKGSQFIVVSLKEGMFNNANVLFKARFRDGTSVVERYEQQQLKAIVEKENETSSGKSKKAVVRPDRKKARQSLDEVNA